MEKGLIALKFDKTTYDRLVELGRNEKTWVDPYDSEEYHNKFIRKLLKRSLYFAPRIFYTFGVLKHKIWPENLGIIGRCFLTLGDVNSAEEVYYQLIDICKDKLYWGLPVDWKSGAYIFPKGAMMSTTTSEIALFFIELRKYSDIVKDKDLQKIGSNLLHGLNKVYEDQERLILGYTAADNYRINNSNLLVAAALLEIGKKINDENLIHSSVKIVNACREGISPDGGVPYQMNGSKYDSYHQLFSIRALYLLKELSEEFDELYRRAIGFLRTELMDEYGNVFLNPRKNTIDMQGSAEALWFFSHVRERSLSKQIRRQIDDKLRTKGGRYIQRAWLKKTGRSIQSKTLFTRQGELRLILALAEFARLDDGDGRR